MALFDVPIHSGYKILTHTSNRRFAKNGFAQVGNTTLPTNPVNSSAVMPSVIYNKNVSLRGISEAGYGRRYPYYGLSYPGAGSPRSSLRYAGAGSYPAGLRYAGAGSPRSSLRDAYINDNVPPGTLGKIGIQGRRNALRGLAQDETAISPASDFGAVVPADTSPGILSTVGNMFSNLFGTAVSATTQAGQTAVQGAITGSILPPTKVSPSPVFSTLTSAKSVNILGMAVPTTALLLGGGVLAYFAFKK